MKNSSYLIILLALALLFVSYKWITSTSGSGDSNKIENMQKTTIEEIMTRTSVRSYTDREIEPEKLDTLLRAAMAAPTAGNKQPWRFVIINDRNILKAISEDFPTMKMAEKAAVAIIACGDVTSTFDGEGREYWTQDVSAATENLLLAAHAMGLGAVWCGIYPISERVNKFSEMLQLPENIIPMACICIGYPDGENTPKDKWRPDYIRYNSWNGDIYK